MKTPVYRQLETLLGDIDYDLFEPTSVVLDRRSSAELEAACWQVMGANIKGQRTWYNLVVKTVEWLPDVPLYPGPDVKLDEIAREDYRQVAVRCRRRDNGRPAYFTSPESHEMWKKQGIDE